MAQVPGLPNRWNSVSMPDIDTGLVGSTTFTVGGKTFVVGGDTSEYFGAHKRRTRQVWVYTHATNTWSKTTPFPGDLRMGAIAFGSTTTGKGYYGLGYDSVGYIDTAYRNKFYDTLGMPQFYDTLPFYHVRFLKDFWQFDTATMGWTRLKDFPILDIPAQDTFPNPLIENGIANATGFSIDTVVTINGSITKKFAGGFIFGEYLEIRWDSTKGTPTPPKYGDMTWDGSVGVLFIKKPYFYDAVLDSFFVGPDMPGPGRSNGAAMILDGKQNVAGKNPRLYAGLGDNDAYNLTLLNIHLKDWYSYDFATNTWKTERVLPDSGKSNVGTFAYEHVGFVTCGYDAEWRKTFFLYNTDDEDWTRYPDYRDSGRSLGSAFIHGNRGFYGAGFRGNSEELESFSWYAIDTNTIRLYPTFAEGDTFCAGSDITFDWYSGITFSPGASMIVQISDKDGIFEYPLTANSNMDTFAIVGQGGTITAKIPHKVPRGGEYKIRILSSSPFYISRNTPTIFVKENPKFTYYPKTHPVLDTVCINADFFIPSKVSGDKINIGEFQYSWLKNGVPTGSTNDTLFINQIQVSHEGEYRLVAMGDCYSDTSVTYYISVENIPAPIILDDLDYPGMVGNDLFICEYDTTTLYVDATGKNIKYQWYHNGQKLDSRDNTEGLGGPVIKTLYWNLNDSGVYKLRVVESCGAYTESDSIHVRMRAIPRITVEPITTDSAYLEGHTVIFEIKATGYALTYQWRKELVNMVDGPRIFGSLTDSLTITQMIPDDVAFYSCVVDGGCPGFTAYSNLATMDLNASPTIIKQPNDTLELCEGASNVITIVAQGTNLRYKWTYANGNPLLPAANFQGTDTRVLTVVDAQLGMSGLIYCEVDNSAGANVFTQTCYLRVKTMPGLPKIQKAGNLLQETDINCPNAKYQWFMNGVWKGQYTSKIINPSEEGDYTVRVICDDCPSPLSDPFYFLTSIVSANLESLEMYPNPTQGKVMLDLPGIHAENPATVRIYDLSGKLVKTIENIETPTYEAELNNLSKGMYIVHVSSQEVSFSGKLVKE